MTRFAIKIAVVFAVVCAGLALEADACPEHGFTRCLRERPLVSGRFCRRQAPKASLSSRRSIFCKEKERACVEQAGLRISASEKRDPRIQYIAVAGLLDINHDGKDDLELIRRVIHANGGQIDAELAVDGKLTGKLRPDMKYIILGELPDKTTVPPIATKQFDAFMRRASELGIPIVPAKKLLVSGSDFGTAKRDAKSTFRPRRPPRQPY